MARKFKKLSRVSEAKPRRVAGITPVARRLDSVGSMARGKLTALAVGLVLCIVGPSAIAAAGAGPDPVVEEWPHWPYPTACDGDPFDPVAVFSSPTGAELGFRPSEVALRNFLRSESWVEDYVPTSNWRLLAETSERAEFASGRLASPGGPSVMSFRQEDGKWKWSGLSSGCHPISIVEGISAITWRLATDQKGLRRNWKSIWINLGPGPCSGGRSQNARALKPIFQQIGKKLLMFMRLRPLPPGGYTCQGVIEPPLKVRLPSRLGKRKLFDGGTYPPADVVAIWREGLPRRSR